MLTYAAEPDSGHRGLTQIEEDIESEASATSHLVPEVIEFVVVTLRGVSCLGPLSGDSWLETEACRRH